MFSIHREGTAVFPIAPGNSEARVRPTRFGRPQHCECATCASSRPHAAGRLLVRVEGVWGAGSFRAEFGGCGLGIVSRVSRHLGLGRRDLQGSYHIVGSSSE